MRTDTKQNLRFRIGGWNPLGLCGKVGIQQIDKIPPASGDRWSRTFVKSSSQNQFNPNLLQLPWRRGLPLLLSSSPGSRTQVAFAVGVTHMRS